MSQTPADDLSDDYVLVNQQDIQEPIPGENREVSCKISSLT